MALAQNYTQSLIHEANDGLGVSNKLAFFLHGENQWSQELFQSSYHSTNASIALLITYTVVLIAEKVQGRMQTEIN